MIRPKTRERKFWAVEVTDLHPALGGKVVKYPFAYREHADLWAREETSAAQEMGISVTTRVFLSSVKVLKGEVA